MRYKEYREKAKMRVETIAQGHHSCKCFFAKLSKQS
jgi:hypothetical protein